MIILYLYIYYHIKQFKKKLLVTSTLYFIAIHLYKNKKKYSPIKVLHSNF